MDLKDKEEVIAKFATTSPRLGLVNQPVHFLHKFRCTITCAKFAYTKNCCMLNRNQHAFIAC